MNGNDRLHMNEKKNFNNYSDYDIHQDFTTRSYALVDMHGSASFKSKIGLLRDIGNRNATRRYMTGPSYNIGQSIILELL